MDECDILYSGYPYIPYNPCMGRLRCAASPFVPDSSPSWTSFSVGSHLPPSP